MKIGVPEVIGWTAGMIVLIIATSALIVILDFTSETFNEFVKLRWDYDEYTLDILRIIGAISVVKWVGENIAAVLTWCLKRYG